MPQTKSASIAAEDSSAAGSGGGYIALISVLMMAAVMLVIVVAVGFGSFFARMDVLGADFKEQSQGLSEACLEAARLKLVQNAAYAGNEIVNVGSSTCRIVSVAASGTQDIILTQGAVQNSYTDLRTTVNASDTSIVGIEELAHF